MRLIDADALIALVQNATILGGGFKQAFCALVNGEPTVEPERTGKWIEYDNSHCECPFCHEEWSYFDNEVEYFNYCPNCGARMES